MGNHEYCTECGEDDFHFGRPCNPERKAEMDARREILRKRAAFRRELTAVLAEAITKAGIPVKVSYEGDIGVNLFEIMDTDYDVYLQRARRLEYKA